MQSSLLRMKMLRSSSRKKNLSNKLWMLFLLSGSVLLNYSVLAVIAPNRALAGNLEFSSGSYITPPIGPSTADQTATFLENTTEPNTFGAYTPTITLKASISNQQYTNGLVFGDTIVAPVATFRQMDVIATPANNMFTANPTGTPGTQVSITDNYAFEMFTNVDPLIGQPLDGKFYYADLTLTFSRPVTDPVIHMTGMGGSSAAHGHSAEFEFITPGITASKLSGSPTLNVALNGTTGYYDITNSATTLGATCPAVGGSSASGGACGSVKFTGTNITELKFKVYVRGDGKGTAWSTAGAHAGDVFLFGGASFAKPVTVSGTVFDDANGLTDNSVNGTGSNAGGLFANLLDSSGKVVASTAVASNGTYSFLAIGAGTYKVSLSTVALVQGTVAPASSLPTNWINTGEGTVLAGDGTVDGNTTITVAAANVTGINFGIEQLPNTTNLTPSSQTNPGGTTTVQVPTFAGTDPEDGALGSGKSFRIVTLPTNGTLTYNNTAVIAGQTIVNYDPTLLKLDPNDGAITVTFTYAAVDAAGKVDPSPATVTMPFAAAPVSLSGTVFDDADGSKLKNGTEVFTQGGGLNAVLVNSSNIVIATTAVAADGTYTFSSVPANANYTVQITTATATVGSTPPAITLSANWVSTGENLNGAIDGTVDSTLSVAVTTTNVTGINFGIEQLPATTDLTSASQPNPGGTATVQVPTLAGTDPEDGALGSGKSFRIVTLPSNGTLTYNNTAVIAGQPIANYDPTLLKLDPNDGAITVTFTYAAVDAAGRVDSSPATVTMPFTAAPVSLSGTVFNDADGSKLKNGTEVFTNGGGLNAVLVNSSNIVIATTAVAADGTYTFSSVPANANYTVQITTATATVGSAPPALTLPANWVSTGENLNGAIDGTVDSKLSVAVTTSNVTGANFGIEQLPNTIDLNPASQTNPGGTTTVQVPTFAGIDPEDGALGSGKSFKIVTLPTNGTLYYNGAAVTAGQTIASYDSTLLTLDPNDGAITVSFTYAAIDAAGQVDSSPATVSMPFSALAKRFALVKRITSINGSTTNLNDPNNPLDDIDLLALVNDGIASSDDDEANWPADYLRGAINAGFIKPGDTVEYTIYFLNADGSAVENVRICDRLLPEQALLSNVYSAGADVELQLGTSTALGLTEQSDASTGIDRAEFIAPSVSVPTTCNLLGNNDDGTLLVDVTGPAGTGVPALTSLPGSTGSGAPNNSYGLIRFRTRITP